MNTALKAYELANRAHAGQFRKYHENVPYIVHPIRVAFSVAGYSETAQSVALLHDVLEDTDVPADEIRIRCGREVLHYVQELTNPSHLPENKNKPRAERKQIDRDHISKVSHLAKVIKLYDRLDNLQDSKNAPDDFKKLYVAESRLLVGAICNGESPDSLLDLGSRVLAAANTLEGK